MEFTNNSENRWIILKVGMRVAKIAFIETEPPEHSSYVQGGKYQSSENLEELKGSWKPENMLPRMDKDWEIVEGGYIYHDSQLSLGFV
jgi:hypothetical protein